MSSTWQRFRPDRNGRADRNGSAVETAAGEPRAPLLRPRTPDPADLPAASRGRSAAGLLRPLPLAGAALVLLALVGYWAVYSATTKRTPVLVAARNLPAGTVLDTTDLRTVELAGDSATMATLLANQELTGVLGRELSAPVAAGAPLSRAAVASDGSRTAAFTLVVPALHALAGALQPGDRVTVLATYSGGDSGAKARVIARSLRVETVGRPPQGLDRASATIPVTVALPDPSFASALALANSEAKLDLLRDGHKTATAPIPPVNSQSEP